MIGSGDRILVPLQSGGIVPRGSRANVFQEIFWVFLVLGTIVGVVVIGYMLYNAYKYRAGRAASKPSDGDRPELGELPTGGGGGRKLFLSFSLSAVIVISLIIWTYGTLLYVESAPAQSQNPIEVQVEGYQFGWKFTYADVPGQENGVEVDGTLRVPRGRMVTLRVTSRDVFHNFAIPELRVKTDALPGQTTETWFRPTETRTYEAQCFELCGAGHSYMNAEVIVIQQSAFQEWYGNQNATA